MTARIVCTNARWARASVRREERVGSQPEAPEHATHRTGHPVELRSEHDGKDELGPGQGHGPQQRRDLLAEAAAGHQHEALHHLGELVGELHGHAAAEAVTHDRGPLVAEHAQEVSDPRRVGAEAVVTSRLRRLAVSQQVGRDHREPLGQQGHDRHPGARAAGDAVHHHQQRARSGLPVGDVVAVDPRPPGGGRLPHELRVGRTEARQGHDIGSRGGVGRCGGGLPRHAPRLGAAPVPVRIWYPPSSVRRTAGTAGSGRSPG